MVSDAEEPIDPGSIEEADDEALESEDESLVSIASSGVAEAEEDDSTKEPCVHPQVSKDDADSDELSDVSDNSDLFHTAIDADKDWITEQDKDLSRIHHVSTLLCERPLFPA